MKVDLSKIVLNQKGEVNITIDDLEDFWTLANIIRIGDKIKSQIRRKVAKISSTGKADQKQILTKATVKITEVDYQPGVDEMQLRGTLCHDIGDVKKGSFQRILLDMTRPFTLRKKCWDKFTIEELREASDPTLTASVAAVMMKSGLASVCVVGRNTTVTIQTVQKSIPKIRQHGGSGKSAEAKQKFFSLTADALKKIPRFQEMKCFIIASPGFLQHEFVQFLRNNAVAYDLQSAFQEDKFIEATVSNGDPRELDEVLLNPDIQHKVSSLKAVQQAKAYEEFLKTMADDQHMIMFGEENIRKAAEDGAVKTLLVTDSYIRNLGIDQRLDFLAFQDNIAAKGVNVIVFSTRHESGTQLHEIGGIVALLRYPIIPPDEELDEEEDN